MPAILHSSVIVHIVHRQSIGALTSMGEFHVVVVGWQEAEMEPMNSISYRIENDCKLTWSHEAYFFNLHEYRDEGYAGYPSLLSNMLRTDLLQSSVAASHCNPLRWPWDI